MESVIMGVGTACAGLFTISNVASLRWMASNSSKVDVGLTLLMFFLFAGTSTMGVLAAVWGGLFVAVFSKCLKSYWNWAAARGYLEPLEQSFMVVSPKKRPSVERQIATVYAKDAIARLMDITNSPSSKH